ncbi:MAG: transketolase, partial [Clostridiales bacterium]|nr:transketolase [Clostridiales bacterium]
MYKNLAKKIRREILDMLYEAGSGHAGGSMSELEILISLYYEVMNIDPNDSDKKDRDRFILSKGHASPGLYAVLANKGYFPQKELGCLRKKGASLQGHPCMTKTTGIDFSTGSLGHGLSVGIGMALGMRLDGMESKVFVLLGDGE